MVDTTLSKPCSRDGSLGAGMAVGALRREVLERPDEGRRPVPRGQRSGGSAGRGWQNPRLAKFRQNVDRFRLYRLRFLQVNMRLTAFFKIYQILKLKFLKFDKILQILRHLQFFC